VGKKVVYEFGFVIVILRLDISYE